MSKIVRTNIFNNIFATLLNILAPLITIPILTSELGMAEYGVYVALLAKTALFVVFAELGFGMYLAKEISVHRDDASKVSSLFCIFLFVKFIVFIIASIILVNFSKEFGFVEVLLCAFILFQFINITPILSGLEDYKFLTKAQLLTKIIMVSMVLFCNFEIHGLEKAIFIQVIVAILSSFILICYFISNYKFVRCKINFSKILIVLRGGFPFYSAKLFVNLYQQSSTYFVSLVLSVELVAIYSIAIQLYKIGQSIIGAVARVLYTSTVKTKDFRLIKNITIKSFVIHLAAFPIVWFYGEVIFKLIFSFDVTTLVDLSVFLYFSLLMVIVSSYWGYPALSAIGKENYAHIGIFVSSIGYFIAYYTTYSLGVVTIQSMIYCVLVADFLGMLVRVYYARRFKLI
ncbi:oligosaccharide flippase family protein [Vibrio sp. 10N.261.51.F12]|uniref:oligosaccharide flippase family protein n=1 Tax=Vibrio sp. 10N.261.51.F12 TaxID=3229679 RepID=UPI003552C318